MARVDEIAADVFRISLYVKEFDLQFNHFLVRDDEPLLYHAGMRGMFPELQAAVSRLIDLSRLRWISWSHFEMDECGALNEWLKVAPGAQAACSLVEARQLERLCRSAAPRSDKRGSHRDRATPIPLPCHTPFAPWLGCRRLV